MLMRDWVVICNSTVVPTGAVIRSGVPMVAGVLAGTAAGTVLTGTVAGTFP